MGGSWRRALGWASLWDEVCALAACDFVSLSFSDLLVVVLVGGGCCPVECVCNAAR